MDNTANLAEFSPERSNWLRLQTLVLLRWMAIGGQLVAIAVATRMLQISLPLGLCFMAVGAAVIANLVLISVYPANKRLNEIEALVARARAWKGLVGLDLAKDVTCAQSYRWDEMRWAWPEGYSKREGAGLRVVAIDYGAKRNILRCLASAGCEVTVLPASATAEDVLALNPEGVFLSNGPGDPAATGSYAVPMIKGVLAADLPVFGICLGHQMLALALGAQTVKMGHGHHGANHPVKDLTTGKVEITSMNHGFTVDSQTLPKGVSETHVSLFDGSNCGIAVDGKPIYSVQYHPEASPGPQDSFYLFERFAAAMQARRAA